MEIKTTPVPKPRMTFRDRWGGKSKRPIVERYHNYLDTLRDAFKKNDFKMGNSLIIIFLMPMAESWSKKKKLQFDGRVHQNKPDLDNLIKAVCELHEKDQEIFSVVAQKFWATEGCVIIIDNDTESIPTWQTH